MTRDQLLAAAIGGCGLLTVLLVAFAVDGGAIRVVIVLAFLLVGPGLAYVRLLRLRDPITAATLAIGASIGLNVVVGTLLLAASLWSPGRMIVLLAIFTFACLVVHQRQGNGDHAGHERNELSARQRAMAALAGADQAGGAHE
jgi:hypothetical protein